MALITADAGPPVRALDEILIDNGAQRVEAYTLCGHCWGSCPEADGDSHLCRNARPCHSHSCTWCGAS